MSKAFTRESDENAEEFVLQPFPPAVGKRYITKEGAERLRQQASALLEEKSALLNGGDAENADTTARIRRVEATILKLERILDSVMIAEPPADPNKVGFGASVCIQYQNGEEETYRIVGVDEAEPNEGRISSASPLAQALMNSRTGDTVQFKSPAGEQQLTILSVAY